ncbi:MAG: UDP-N-acetylmuramoyl-L-alanyl-D-glutamate--2,6-diaminopimelate ligase [Bacteroidales bacterium]|nr:UDP-N-acetylmuramoyl-L-alanyl-D-glutamate--2,6-diaminopimelate ligase [Bacteroidales bacterium]
MKQLRDLLLGVPMFSRHCEGDSPKQSSVTSYGLQVTDSAQRRRGHRVTQSVIVSKVCFDSRDVIPDALFVATSGSQTDGHRFIDKAIENGASVVVCERLPEIQPENVNFIVVEDSAAALGEIASAFYDHPSRKLKLVGVTGTNGKTTIATLLYMLHRKLGYATGLISTVENKINDTTFPTTHTTPDAVTINALLAEMVDAGCSYCFMEVSSHAVVQQRIAGLHFAGGIFTNLTHEHLDYHGSFKNYLDAKKAFFDALPKDAFALTNADDTNGGVMLQNTKAHKYYYALKNMADFRCHILESHFGKTLLYLNDDEIWTNLTGEFNAYNIAAIYGSAICLGHDKQEVLQAVSALYPVAGRFETIVSENGIFAITDYAHTPDALENVLTAINSIRFDMRCAICDKENNILSDDFQHRGTEFHRDSAQRHRSTQSENIANPCSHIPPFGGAWGGLITVVGCGGDRDKEKRPKMAEIACRLSDRVIFTSDNPRTEDPETILDEMEKGVNPADYRKKLRITNRREAIKTAVALAQKNDIILIAGKGHEQYQEVNGIRTHFDDKEEVKNAFCMMCDMRWAR